jgi:hypothetical protein
MKNKVGMALRELHRSERDLAGQLLQASDRHKVDHEIFYVARDIARWSQEHVRELARVGEGYGVGLDPNAQDDSTVIAMMRQKSAELLGRRHDPALLLLSDLRRIHRMAAGVSLDWEILAQTAQALKDHELLALAKECHPETLRQMRWANAQLKAQSAQVMVTA